MALILSSGLNPFSIRATEQKKAKKTADAKKYFCVFVQPTPALRRKKFF